ncbi:MAG: ATP-binding protein [Cyanobacteria bacterium P01_F01_bin.150]
MLSPMTFSPVPDSKFQNIRYLQRAILGYSALTLLLLSSSVAVVSLLPLYRGMREERQEHLLDALHSRSLTVVEWKDRTRQIALQIASRTTARQQLESYNRGDVELVALRQKSQELLLDALQKSHDVVGITRLDIMQQPIIDIGMKIPTEAWPIPPHQSQPAEVKTMVEHIDDRTYIVVGAPIVNARGERVGTDIVLFDADKLQQILADFEGWGATGNLLLGTVWQDRPQLLLPNEKDKQIDRQVKTAMTLAWRGDMGLLSNRRQTTTVAYTPVTESLWVLVAVVDSKKLYAPVWRQLWNIVGTTGILILLSIGGMLLLLQPLTGRIILRAEELAEIVRSQTAALREARDDLERRVDERTAQLSQEVSDRKHAEAELQAVSERLTLALRSGDLGYWQWLLATNEVYWDDRLYELHGIPKGIMDYDIFCSTVHPDDVVSLQELMRRAIAEESYENEIGHSIPYEVIYRTAGHGGETNYLKAYGSVLRDQAGKVTGLLGVTFNITRFKLAEKQLALSNQELKRASQMKDEFLATMSHELRTPLNAVLGMAEILQKEIYGAVNPRQRDALNIIEQSSQHLLNLINGILDLSKIAAGQMQLYSTPTDVAELCHNSLSLIRQQAQLKQLQLHLKCPDSIPCLMLDQQRIYQVLINLLNNAVKFTPEEGQITLLIDPQPVPDPAGFFPCGFLRLTVSDTGIGIPPEDIDKLFQPFFQVDSTLNRHYEGTGLGLALVKRFVELHRGRVSVKSKVSVGSSFTVELPWTVAVHSPAYSSIPQANVAAIQANDVPDILLAEDDTANIRTLSSYLEATGYCLAVVRNGQEAVELIQKWQPKLVLMDVQMPVMDGLEATQYIRQTLDLVDIPIIALTALALEGDQERCLEAGANDYLSKPIRLEYLDDLLKRYLLK